MDPGLSRKVALEAAERLAALLDGDGRFLYRYDADTGATVEGYNTTRHAGTVWLLAGVANGLGASHLLAPAGRAMEWLLDRHLRPFASDGLLCVEENDVLELAGAALAVMALLELDRAGPEARLRDLARGLGIYLLSQRRADGGFVHRRGASSGEALDFVSPFTDGETLLALGALYASGGDRRFLEPALETESMLAARDFGVADQSHWMLYAIEALEAAEPVAAHRAHACRIAAGMVVYPIYREQGASTSISCRCEALAAYLRMLRRRAGQDDLPDEDLVRPELEQSLRRLLDYRTPDGGFIQSSAVREVQIDIIQHAAAAYLSHALLFGPDERPARV